MNIDWSKAPQRATHCTPKYADCYTVFWRVENGEALEAWTVNDDYGVMQCYSYRPGEGCPSFVMSQAIARPAPWTGEGLPPVGMVCELRAHKLCEWGRAVIRFASRNVVVWEWEDEPENGGLCTRYINEVEIRPTSTPEQIAAEERAKVIADMAKEIGPGFHSPERAAECLYDAGYRKQVAP